MALPLVLKTLSALSLPSLYRIADFCSLLVRLIPNKTSKVIRQNIHLCFAEQGTEQLYRSTIRQICYSALELAAVWCWPAEKILARIINKDICESFSQSRKARIVIAPHLGSWELLNLWLASQGDLISLYKPRSNTRVDQFVLKTRSRNGAHLVPINASGLRQLSLSLKQGKTAMILPDQRPKKKKVRVMAKFFGLDAPTTPMIHNLCSRIDCDIFLASIFRDRANASFELTLLELDHDRIAADQQSGLDYLNSEIEALIKQAPEQYQWSYRRFKPSAYRV
ncbi:MAG: hypothetical protein R8K20_01390 [Gallionellaceae bacterium]